MKKRVHAPNEELMTNTFTIPNVLSFLRIVLITPFVVLFLMEDYVAAACIIVVSGLTDCFDGMIARKLHQESELGKVLDPLADKLTLLAVGVCLIFIEPFVLPLMIVLVLKDLLMLIGGSIIIKKGIIPPKSKWYGKLGTVLFYVTVSVIVGMKIFNYVNITISVILLSLTVAVMVFALVMYIITFSKLMKNYNDEQNNTSKPTAQVSKNK